MPGKSKPETEHNSEHNVVNRTVVPQEQL